MKFLFVINRVDNNAFASTVKMNHEFHSYHTAGHLDWNGNNIIPLVT